MTTTTDITSAAAALGRKGGSAKSEAKTNAVRANGALGGRPAYGIEFSDDHTIYKFPSAAARDAWVAEWADFRSKIGSKDFTYRWHGLKTNYICTLIAEGSQCFYRDLTA